MSQHSRRQINDLVLQQMSSVVKAVCDGGTASTNTAVWMAAAPLVSRTPPLSWTPTRAVRAAPALQRGVFLGGWGAISSNVLWFFPRRATRFKMLEICLLTHILWLQRLLIGAEGYLIQALLLPCSFYLQWCLKKLIYLSTLWRSERQYWSLMSHTMFLLCVKGLTNIALLFMMMNENINFVYLSTSQSVNLVQMKRNLYFCILSEI